MGNQEQYLLEHAFMNQLESDFEDQDFDAMSEMIQLLLKNKDNRNIIIEYLSDSAKKNWLEGKTSTRF